MSIVGLLCVGNTLRFKFREDQRKEALILGGVGATESEEKRKLLEDELISE